MLQTTCYFSLVDAVDVSELAYSIELFD